MAKTKTKPAAKAKPASDPAETATEGASVAPAMEVNGTLRKYQPCIEYGPRDTASEE